MTKVDRILEHIYEIEYNIDTERDILDDIKGIKKSDKKKLIERLNDLELQILETKQKVHVFKKVI